MTINLGQLLRSDLSLADAGSSAEGITKSSVSYIRKRKREYSRDLLHI